MNPSDTSVSFRPCDLRVMALLKGFVFIMESRPLLSWKISSDRTGFRQSAYRILAASDKAELLAGNADLWDSGRVESDRSLYVEWGGKELASRQHVCWQVTVWDENGMESEASEIAEFEIALQHNAEWEARWIHFDGNNPACSSPSPISGMNSPVEKRSQKPGYMSPRADFSRQGSTGNGSETTISSPAGPISRSRFSI